MPYNRAKFYLCCNIKMNLKKYLYCNLTLERKNYISWM